MWRSPARACAGKCLGEDVKPGRVRRSAGQEQVRESGLVSPHGDGRTLRDFAILSPMTQSASITTLRPRWTASIAVLRQLQNLVRTQCRRCGALMRADLDDLAGRYGVHGSLFDRQERCRMVACDGAAFYLAARHYGGPWHILLGDPALRAGLDAGPEPLIANGLPLPTSGARRSD